MQLGKYSTCRPRQLLWGLVAYCKFRGAQSTQNLQGGLVAKPATLRKLANKDILLATVNHF